MAEEIELEIFRLRAPPMAIFKIRNERIVESWNRGIGESENGGIGETENEERGTGNAGESLK